MYPDDSVLIAFVALFVWCPHHKYISFSTQYAHSEVIYDSKPYQATSDDIRTIKTVFFIFLYDGGCSVLIKMSLFMLHPFCFMLICGDAKENS